MSKRLGGIIGYKDKTSSWHLNGFHSSNIGFTVAKEADLVCGICGAHGGYETAEVLHVRRISRGRGLCGGSGKRGNVAERRNKGRNISWRNGSLQRKPRLNYGMQSCART